MELDPSVMLSGGEYERALRWIADRSESGPLQLKATCAPHYFRILAQHRQRNHASKHETTPQPSGAPPSDNTGRGGMHTLTKGCLAGQSVCFVSHRGQVFPCGYLPVECGNIKDQPLETIWRDSQVFASLRDDSQLTGKCGCCEYKAVCMGCRARAYAHSGDWLAEEPNCAYVPDAMRR
jgi:radical SAM protein with 4Fe4S-binding SPASM domain